MSKTPAKPSFINKFRIYKSFTNDCQSLETATKMSYAENLDNMIRESYRGNLEELSELWETMGLSKDEIEQRMNTVRTKVSDITIEMVECDRENKMKKLAIF